MIPAILYRTQSGCTYEEYDEALTESIDTASSDVYNHMRSIESYFTKPAKDVIAQQSDIRNAHKGLNELAKTLYAAMEGKLITEYKKK